MWHRKINGHNVAKFPLFSGISLIEILLSLTLGSFLLFILSKYFSDHYYNQVKQRELLNLQQHTHQLLTYFQQHIQHIGYQGRNRDKNNYNLFLTNNKAYQLNNPQCLLFFYDVNGDGCLGSRIKKQECEINGVNNTKDVNKEIFGFTFKNKNLFVFDDNFFSNCYKNQCQNWSKNCSQYKWSNITELSDYQVEHLAFNWIKVNQLMKIELQLSSVKLPLVQYQSSVYSYLLNNEE